MTLAATPLYAGILALLFVLLSARVIQLRAANRQSLGDGGDKALEARIRAQANCAEYAPIGLLLLLLVEIQGAPVWATHLLGVTLLGGRALHAVGLSASPQLMPLRQLGMVLTFTMIILSALGLIGHALF